MFSNGISYAYLSHWEGDHPSVIVTAQNDVKIFECTFLKKKILMAGGSVCPSGGTFLFGLSYMYKNAGVDSVQHF